MVKLAVVAMAVGEVVVVVIETALLIVAVAAAAATAVVKAAAAAVVKAAAAAKEVIEITNSNKVYRVDKCNDCVYHFLLLCKPHHSDRGTFSLIECGSDQRMLRSREKNRNFRVWMFPKFIPY